MSQQLDKVSFAKALPPSLSASFTAKMEKHIKKLLKDPALQENFQDNLIDMTSILEKGKYKLQDYVNAVTYVSYKLLGDSNVLAYSKTFPKRIATFVKAKRTDKAISGYVWAYNKNKLVTELMTQTLTPMHVTNYAVLQRAINKQAALMNCGNVVVEQRAADSLMAHLAAPEIAKVELDVKIGTSNVMADLLATTRQLAEQQKAAIEDRVVTAKQVAGRRIIEAETFEEEEDG